MRECLDITDILEEHYDTIFAFAVRALGCRDAAQDLTQDVCLSLAEKLPAFRGESRVTTWLYRIVANAARDRLRASARHERLEPGVRDRVLADAAARDEAAAARDWVRDAMGVLDPTERTLLSLVVTLGLTQGEAAEILEMAPGTVAWRMGKIRKRLAAFAMETGDVA